MNIANTAAITIKVLEDAAQQTELWSFLGLNNAFCCFVLNFNSVAAPLHRALHNYERLHLQVLPVNVKNRVEQLRFLLTKTSVLALPQPDGQLAIDNNACDMS